MNNVKTEYSVSSLDEYVCKILIESFMNGTVNIQFLFVDFTCTKIR